jgi:ABC-2 type transport system ATP-binding protein
MMCGLTPTTAGDVTVLGAHYADIPNPGRHVGVLLDASAQHAGRTGREVLRIGAETMGLDLRRVDEMLEVVGLTPVEAKRRVGNYSLGMRQRLGIAHALIGDPHVLILDEPANGLDPAGIHWMRGVLRGFVDRGGTVLLSSHLLNEVEVVADELVVIGHGRIVAEGTKEELLSSSGVYVNALDNAARGAALTRAGIDYQPAARTGFTSMAAAEDVGRAAAQDAIVLLELRSATGAGLEELFLSLTSDDAREKVTP